MNAIRSIAAAASIILAVSAPSSAQLRSKTYGDLLDRVPEPTNLLMLIDSDGLANSPFAKSEGWGSDPSKDPLGIDWRASLAVMATNVDWGTMREHWKLGMAVLRDQPPDLKAMAVNEGGYVDTIDGSPVAWTPSGYYLLSFPGRVVAYAQPGDRQKLRKWLAANLGHPSNHHTAFADRALYRADAGSQVSIAIDLSDSISAGAIMPTLKASDAIAKAGIDPTAASRILAKVKWLTVDVAIKETVQGRFRLDFGEPIAYVSPALKGLIQEIMEEHGAFIPEFSRWTSSARIEPDAQFYEIEGALSVDSLRKLVSLAQPPKPSSGFSSGARTSASPTNPPAAGPPDVVKASQRYFRTVIDLTEDLKRVERPNYSSLKLWYDRYAKRIEELPILGVDKDLLDWGAKVAMTLRGMASGINYSSQNKAYMVASAANTQGGYNYGGYDLTLTNSTLKTQTRAALSVSLDANWQAIATETAAMRRMLTERYQVEF